MKVRETDVAKSDIDSARLFFNALAGFYDLTDVEVLDAFARNGQLTVDSYVPLLKGTSHLDLWELGEEHRDALTAVPHRNIRIGCSYETAETWDLKYDMVVIDTPQGIHNDYADVPHVEHFDFYKLALRRLLKPKSLVILYCNKTPYNRDEVGSHGYDEYAEYDFKAWMKGRRDFYSTTPQNVSLAEMLNRYAFEAMRAGFDVTNHLVVPCYSDVEGLAPYSFRLAMDLKKI